MTKNADLGMVSATSLKAFQSSSVGAGPKAESSVCSTAVSWCSSTSALLASVWIFSSISDILKRERGLEDRKEKISSQDLSIYIENCKVIQTLQFSGQGWRTKKGYCTKLGIAHAQWKEKVALITPSSSGPFFTNPNWKSVLLQWRFRTTCI